MNWYYAQAGQQLGPVSAGDFEQLVATRVILDETLVWCEGMAGWQPYASVKPARLESATGSVAGPVDSAPPSHADDLAPGSVRCAECGGVFPMDDTLEIAGVRVCATCKPAHLQRLREGAAVQVLRGVPGGTGDGGTATAAEIVARDYEIDPMERLNEAWRMLFREPGVMLLGGMLVFLVITATQFVPIIGGILAMVIGGPLLGGLAVFYLRRHRGEAVHLGDAFGGFSLGFGALVLARVVPTVLAMLVYLPGGILMGIGLYRTVNGGGPPDAVGFSMLAIGGILLLAGILVSTWLSILWMYTLPLVADKGYHFWDAMGLSRQVVNRHFWQNLWLMILCGLVVFAGMLALCVGVLVAFPLVAAAGTLQYNRLFGDLAPVRR